MKKCVSFDIHQLIVCEHSNFVYVDSVILHFCRLVLAFDYLDVFFVGDIATSHGF